jgi:hypothetical protein
MLWMQTINRLKHKLSAYIIICFQCKLENVQNIFNMTMTNVREHFSHSSHAMEINNLIGVTCTM